MKRLLNILGIVLLSSAIIPNLSQNRIVEDREQQDERIILPVPSVRQEGTYFCVPATIQAIFMYYGISSSLYTQTRIYNELRDQEVFPPDAPGIILSEDVDSYMSTTLSNEGNHGPVAYHYHYLNRNFGTTMPEIRAFQDYVYQSLQHHQPLIFSVEGRTAEVGHAWLIVGIETNDVDPWFTQYTYMNPSSGERHTFFAYEMRLHTYYGAEIIGYGNIFDKSRWNEAVIGIRNHEIGRNDLNDYENHKVLDLRVDLSTTTAVTTTGEFRNKFSEVSLNDFNGEIYNFTWRKAIRDFSISTEDIPDNDDNWKGPLIEVASSREDIGSAHIEGRIGAKLEFERTNSLKHLLLHLVIYVGGISWATPNWAHVWFITGTILSFLKK